MSTTAAIFPPLQRSMEAQERGAFQDDGGTDQPSRAQAACTRRDEALSEAEVGGPFPRAIEDQQLRLDENGLGHHGPGAPPGPASRATVASRWRNRTARSRIAPSQQAGAIREMLRNLEFAMHKGHTPLTFSCGHPAARAELNNVRWVSHCRDLVQLPVAA